MPGAKAPPRNSPLAEIASTLVDVPKSTTTHAVLCRWWAAKVFTSRSAPTYLGLSTSSGTPVRTPGSMTTFGSPG